MKIKKVVGECLIKMGEKDFTSSTETLTDEQKELQEKLLGAINIAYREITSIYLPLYHTQKVTFKDKKCALTALAKKMLYPIEIAVNGEKRDFDIEDGFICADIDGEASIRYAYIPETELTINSEIPDLRLTQSALCDGALGEYYFQTKVFDLAKNFDTDFRVKMSALRYKGRCVRIKARRWRE